jgi:putative transcriptional regulator
MTTMFEDLMTGLDEVEAFLGGETTGYKVTLPAEVDVKAIRKRLNMTQSRFSDTFGFSLDAVKHWEGGRRTPESSARAFLTVIARNPKAVISALHQPAARHATKSIAAPRGTKSIAAPHATKSVAAASRGRWRRPTKAAGRAQA